MRPFLGRQKQDTSGGKGGEGRNFGEKWQKKSDPWRARTADLSINSATL